MSRITLPLSQTEIRKAKPKEKAYKLYDGDGLYLSILPSGKKVWRFDYVDGNKKRQTHTIGSLEFIGLTDAREERSRLRAKLFKDKSLKYGDDNILDDVFNDWLEKWKVGKAESSVERARGSYKNHISPYLGKMSISEIATRDIVVALDKMDEKGSREMLNKAKSYLKQCFDFAVGKGMCENNPVLIISNKIFSKQVKENFRHLTKYEVYKIHEIINKDDYVPTRLCAEFMIRNMTRPSESAKAEWSEWDADSGILSLNDNRTKTKIPHKIPVSRQSIDLLEKIKAHSDNEIYIFSGENASKHLRTSSILGVINDDGIDSTAHGFRHLVSTILNESMLFNRDIVEVCLSHADKDSIRSIYNKAEYLAHRRELLQWWSDFIDMCDTKENNLKALKKFNII